MDNDIKLLPAPQRKIDLRKATKELGVKINMSLVRIFRQRSRLYLIFFIEFLFFSLLSAVIAYCNPFLLNIIFGCNKLFFKFVFAFLLMIMMLSGITVLGVATSVFVNAVFSCFSGLMSCRFLSIGELVSFEMVTSLINLALLVSLLIIFSAEIFFVSKSIWAGKCASFKIDKTLFYLFYVSIMSYIIFNLANFFI
jgi:hypothetical protein